MLRDRAGEDGEAADAVRARPRAASRPARAAQEAVGGSIDVVDVASESSCSIIQTSTFSSVDLGFAGWSPDGTNIAYTRCVDNSDVHQCDVWTAASDGSNRVRVTRTAGTEGELAWAP